MSGKDHFNGLVILVVGIAAIISSIVRQAYFPDSRWWNLVMVIALFTSLVVVLWRAHSRSI